MRGQLPQAIGLGLKPRPQASRPVSQGYCNLQLIILGLWQFATATGLLALNCLAYDDWGPLSQRPWQVGDIRP